MNILKIDFLIYKNYILDLQGRSFNFRVQKTWITNKNIKSKNK